MSQYSRFEEKQLIYFMTYSGELAQTVERPLSMREVPGSIPGFSKEIKHIFATHCNIFLYFLFFLLVFFPFLSTVTVISAGRVPSLLLDMSRLLYYCHSDISWH